MAPRLIDDMTPWNVVAEYFRLFRYALTAYIPIAERSNTFVSLDMYESRMHHDFLKTALAPDVIVDNDKGVDVLLKCWRFISISQPNYDVQIVHLENGPGGVVAAKTKVRIVMCDNMLHFTFPHLAKSGRGRYLAAQLRNQRFEIAGSTIFGWDSENRCMTSLYNKSDPLTPISRFLGNIEDLSFVFDKAHAAIEGRMILSPSA
ncbi:hypothetical protein PHMEG_00014157 [Phytophthora megakarya]|uniref:Uncharacterized protein n=1 Tax=Phytophthora megakarya TaxID=4795 RepID=A0A225W5L1_9STRA|nr:hypothetical protein PHMEG_00014157 [Phytophthora megakarya]